MEHQSIFSDRKYNQAVIAAVVLSLIYITINLFVIGGDEFVYVLNNNFNIPLAILTVIIAFLLWNLVNIGQYNRLLWGGLLLGWALWTIAEILWVVFGYLYQEVPYPSAADFFWLLGYLPMGYGLYHRIREIPLKQSKTQMRAIWIMGLATILITIVFILIPTIQNNDPSRWLESALNIIYPLADLVLLVIVLRIAFVYTKGNYGFGWVLLTIGFILHSGSNLLFSYAVIADLYYPDLKVNLISGLGIDAPYNLSYLLWVFGLRAIHRTLTQYQPFLKITTPQIPFIPNTYLLIFLRGDNTVISASKNLEDVLGTTNEKGKHLTDLLNITDQDAEAILMKIRNEGQVTTHPVQVRARSGNVLTAHASGVATFHPLTNEYSGCNLVLQILDENNLNNNKKLTDEQRLMVAYLLKQSGLDEEIRSKIKKVLFEYHLVYLRQLYNLAFRTGGAQLGFAFMENLRQTADKNNWQLKFSLETLLVDTDYNLQLLQESLPALLVSAKQQISQLIDPSIMEAEIQAVSSEFSEMAHKTVTYCINYRE